MNLSEPFIRRPVATSLLSAAIGSSAGLPAYTRLPVAPLPHRLSDACRSTPACPGASPETMASAVAAPLERLWPHRWADGDHLGKLAGGRPR